MRKGAGRTFVGFLLTVILSVVLAATCFGISMKTTVFSGNNFKDLLKNMDLGSIMEEVVFDSLDEADKEANNGLGSSGIKFSETILSEDVVSDITNIMLEGFTEDVQVDFSGIKDGCMNALTEMSGQTVEDVIDELKSTSNVIDAETLRNNKIIKQYQEELNVDIATPILEQMETVYGSKSVNLDEVNVDEVKAEAKEAINTQVMPELEKKVDQFIDETNTEVNMELEEFRRENDVESITDIFDPIFGMLLKYIIIGSVFAVILMILQFLVYKKAISKAFKNIGISSLLAAISMFACSLLCNLLADLASDSFNSGTAVDNSMISVIDNTITKVGGASKVTSFILAGVFVVLLIVSIILKVKFGEKDEVKRTNTSYANTNQGSPYAFNVVADQSSQNNMYGQQPVANNMYGQQPAANNMYGQQPVANDMYGQQPVANDMYGQQPTASDISEEQVSSNDSFDNTQM